MKKPAFLTDKDIATIRSARKVFDKIDKKLNSIQSKRDEIDQHKEDDKGGVRWMKLTTELYDTLDYLYEKLNIDAYKYPKFFKKTLDK